MLEHLPKNANFIRHLINLWPPFLFAGIKITELSPDFKHCRVVLKHRSFTKNLNGTQYGGSLFAMSDPIYSLMLICILGKRYHVWDKMAEIEFKKPGKTDIVLNCTVSDQMLELIYQKTIGGNKFLYVTKDSLYDTMGNEVASVIRTLYIRLKAEYRPINIEGGGTALK